MNTAKQDLETIAIKFIDRGKLAFGDLVVLRTVDLFLEMVGCRSTSITIWTSSPVVCSSGWTLPTRWQSTHGFY